MRTREQIEAAIIAIDFTDIIWKLVNSKGWDKPRAERAVEDYKRFLVLTATRPGADLVPGADIDEVWHTHILFTEQYHHDCDMVFGSYLHHMPWTGTEGAHCNVRCKRAATAA